MKRPPQHAAPLIAAAALAAAVAAPPAAADSIADVGDADVWLATPDGTVTVAVRR
jgi:hypothetical protein